MRLAQRSHVAYGYHGGEMVTCMVESLEDFVNGPPETRVVVEDDEGGRHLVEKRLVHWVRMEPIRRVS